MVKTQEFHAGNHRTYRQRRCQVNRVEGANRFHRKRTPRSINNVRAGPPYVPMRSPRIQMRTPIGGSRFIDLSEHDSTDQPAIALDERQIGGRHQLRPTEYLAYALAIRFSQQPCQYRAGFRVDVHTPPRSSSRSAAARRRLRSGESFGYTAASFGAPSVSCPRLASATSSEDTLPASTRCPGGINSATTSPRSVTSTPSPDRTSRMYSLKRFFNSRRPTLFIDPM